MGMTAIATTLVAAVAGGTQAVMANQQAQHAKGAAEAENTAMQDQIKQANLKDKQDQAAKATQGSATQTAAMAALKASMSANNSGTILTSGQGTPAAPTQNKTLLGA